MKRNRRFPRTQLTREQRTFLYRQLRSLGVPASEARKLRDKRAVALNAQLGFGKPYMDAGLSIPSDALRATPARSRKRKPGTTPHQSG